MDEANKSPDAASDFFLINKSFFLKALAQSKPAKWEKWRVWSRGWTHERLCSRSLAEAQNDIMVKMKGKWSTVSVINPSSDTSSSALLLLPGSISINTNLLSLFHTHKHAGEITYRVREPRLCPARDLTQNFSRRPEIFSPTSTGADCIGFSMPPRVTPWNHLSAIDGQVI